MVGSRFFWCAHGAFVLAGMAQTLLAFEFDRIGFARNSTNLINAVGNPLGQFLFLAFHREAWSAWDRRLLLCAMPIVIGELGCNFFSQVAIQKSGSGMYQLVYSFVVVLNALLGHALLGKKLSLNRWLALACICGAIALASVSQLHLVGVNVVVQLEGIAAGLIATLLVAGVYVAANVLLEKPWDIRVSKALVLAQMLGMMEVSIIGVYFLLYVMPNWDQLVVANLRPDMSIISCLGLYAFYVLICGVHQFAFYYTCSIGPTGAVSAGINKCVQTAGLFFLSSLFFCDCAASQCLSILKVVSAVAVCTAVMAYAWLTARESRPTEIGDENELVASTD
ncbi:unnamed protein product [Prorocentrum cordatum]|uniref:EamA domain-containing protein n=1 Tax=Prorocentrum cordatum TaxID=2364126 RepID=A0ABN9X0J1_9DINO|nr:unnamed protein product [Polarella glacialis]